MKEVWKDFIDEYIGGRLAEYGENTWVKLTEDQEIDNIISYIEDKINISAAEGLRAPNKKECLQVLSELERTQRLHQEITLSKGNHNKAKVSRSRYSSWKLYERMVLKQKGWSSNSIRELRLSAESVLKELSLNMKETGGPKKGLVVGEIQSGKTAHMAGLMSMAADNGFNVFIVLSGMIDKLRQQTEQRLQNDLVRQQVGGDITWNLLGYSDIDRRVSSASLELGKRSHKCYLVVGLKNKARLQELKEWLDYDPNKKRMMKVLIIDDEADQASINTRDVDKKERTTINRLITDIVNDGKFGAMNYVAYTATPFANVLNEVGDDTLYPQDFIKVLTSSENYIGLDKIFGTPDPNYSDGLNIVRKISDDDRDLIVEKQNSDEIDWKVPSSFKEAINWFVLCLVALRSRNYTRPVSMMIHTDFRLHSHEIISKKVEEYLRTLRDGFPSNLKTLKKQYVEEVSNVSLADFFSVMKGYEQEVEDYPSWDDVERELRELFELPYEEYSTRIIQNESNGHRSYGNGIHLCIDNSKSGKLKDDDEVLRLIYPEEGDIQKKAPGFIVIGGNTLSRGLTLEGLISTFFLRDTNQADTLLQMARWLGYRIGYELFPRIWLDSAAFNRYSFLQEMNNDLLEQWQVYSVNETTPLELAPKIKMSPSYINVKITSNNKMQNAVPSSFDFDGVNKQVVIFSTKNKDIESNLIETKAFLNNLGETTLERKNAMVWKNVPVNAIENYLSKYKGVREKKKVDTVPNILKWVIENDALLDRWNVVYAGVGSVKKARIGDEWSICGRTIDPVNRSVRKTNSKKKDIINIGTLRSRGDLLSDLDPGKLDDVLKKMSIKQKSDIDERSMIAIRKAVGEAEIPQLIIYRIDKNSKNLRNAMTREDLNTSNDLIGLSFMFPSVLEDGGTRSRSIEYTSIDLDD
ncbi:Z1 domain-containing protein [Limosilactobacillus fermentum]